MAKEDNKSALMVDSFDGINVNKSSEQMQAESLGIVPSDNSRVSKGAAAGCKPGSSRKSFVLPLELIDKIGAIAAHTRRKEVAVVLDLLERGIASCEQQYGKNITALATFDVQN